MINRRLFFGIGSLALATGLLMAWFSVVSGGAARAREKHLSLGEAAFSPPVSVTLEMYRLTASGAQRLPLSLCAQDDTAFGCTAFCNEDGFGCPLNPVFPYPYLTGTITVGVETEYLLNVVPREMGPWYNPEALAAQAVAARSFAFYYAANPPTAVPYNNSTSYQAFIPRTFERQFPENYPNDDDFLWDDPCGTDYDQLNSSQQLVCDSQESYAYLSFGDESPLRAQFSADAYAQTVDGSTVGLEAVQDPISTACDADNFGHGRGMSQEGASRWGRGHECSYAGAPVVNENNPGGAWSLSLNRDQILTHYYTGVHLRGQNGEQISPNYRWTPLEVRWNTADNQPPVLAPPLPYPIMMWIQNSGTTVWLTGTVGVVQDWSVMSSTFRSVMTLTRWLPPGASLQVPVTLTTDILPHAGVYTLTVDLGLADGAGGWLVFRGLNPALPWYPFSELLLAGNVKVNIFLPMIQGP